MIFTRDYNQTKNNHKIIVPVCHVNKQQYLHVSNKIIILPIFLIHFLSSLQV